MRETREELQRQIDAIDWYHEFDFGDGLRAVTKSDAALHRRFWKFIEMRLDTIDFKGKTVLDIGCWDGYWSFYAERRGAKACSRDRRRFSKLGAGLWIASRQTSAQIQNRDQPKRFNL